MATTIIRTDRWQINPTTSQCQYLEHTEAMYCPIGRAMIGVSESWPEISSAGSPRVAVERLIHTIRDNPNRMLWQAILQVSVLPTLYRKARYINTLALSSGFSVVS